MVKIGEIVAKKGGNKLIKQIVINVIGKIIKKLVKKYVTVISDQSIDIFCHILLIIEGCSMVQQTIWPRNHTSHTKVYFNEFVANALRDNIESKRNQPLSSKKKNEAVFSFKYQKFRVRVNHTITLFFVLKFLHIIIIFI